MILAFVANSAASILHFFWILAHSNFFSKQANVLSRFLEFHDTKNTSSQSSLVFEEKSLLLVEKGENLRVVLNRIAISRLTEFDFGNFIPKKSQNGKNNVQYAQKMEILMH